MQFSLNYLLMMGLLLSFGLFILFSPPIQLLILFVPLFCAMMMIFFKWKSSKLSFNRRDLAQSLSLFVIFFLFTLAVFFLILVLPYEQEIYQYPPTTLFKKRFRISSTLFTLVWLTSFFSFMQTKRVG